MSRSAPAALLLALLVFSPCAADTAVGWRGNGTGLFPEANPPLEWYRIPKGVLADLRSRADRPADKAEADAAPLEKGLVREWLVLGPLPVKESQRLQQRLRTALHPDTTYADVVRPSPEGTASSATLEHRLGDYFTDIRLLPGESAGPLAFRIVFSRRTDAGPFCKDLMARTLQEIRKSSPGATTTLEYRGDEEPEALDAIA